MAQPQSDPHNDAGLLESVGVGVVKHISMSGPTPVRLNGTDQYIILIGHMTRFIGSIVY